MDRHGEMLYSTRANGLPTVVQKAAERIAMYETDKIVDLGATRALNQSRARSVQDHIDELPMWVDGTLLSAPPMTRMQWLIWSLAAAGKFFTGFILFMTGVALPLFFNEFRNQASGARRY